MYEMLNNVFSWLIVAVAVEAIVEILVASDLFDGFRRFWAKLAIPAPDEQHSLKHTIFWCPYKIFTCGYCLSVWVAGLVVLLDWSPASIIVKLFVIHRLSNLCHMAIQVLWRGRVNAHDITLRRPPAGQMSDDSIEVQ